MKQLFILFLCLPGVLHAQHSTISIAHFGPVHTYRVERHARFGDTALYYMRMWQRPGLSRDSQFYYQAMEGMYRHAESERQFRYNDSAWMADLHGRQHGWKPYHTGSQEWHYPMKLDFLNNSDQYISCPGEYVPMDIDVTAGIFYSHAGNGTPATIPGSPANAAIPIGGPHNACGLTANGQLWCYGGWTLNGQIQTVGGIKQGVGVSNMGQINRDSLGNTLDPIFNCFLSGTNYGNFWNIGFVTTTGKAYIGGELEGYNEGNGTWGNQWAAYPVQVQAAGNPFFTKIQGGYIFLAMDSAGNAWDWGGNGYNYWLGQGNSPSYKTPTKLTLPAGYKVRDIASNGSFSYLIAYDASGTQHIFAFGQQYYEDYIGISGQATLGTTLMDITAYLTPYLEVGHKIAKIYTSSNATLAILDNGHLYGWGGCPCGELGNGVMLNWWNNGPFFWNFGPHQCQQIHPTRLLPGVNNIMGAYVCQSNSFYNTVYDSAYNSGSAGRNKSGTAQLVALPQDSTTSLIGALYVQGSLSSLPDSWEERSWRKNKGNRIQQNHPVTSNWCILNPTSSANGLDCAGFSNPASGLPLTGSLTATVTNGYVVLNANNVRTSNGTVIIRMFWSQPDSATAPSKMAMRWRAESVDTIFSDVNGNPLASGVYNATCQLITEHYDTVLMNVQFVTNVTQPTVSILGGSPQYIYLPQTSTILTASAAGTGGATITGYSWTQQSGPNSATIVNNSGASTSITGMIQGSYVFKITVTDSNGNTASATVTVTVLALNGLNTPYPILVGH